MGSKGSMGRMGRAAGSVEARHSSSYMSLHPGMLAFASAATRMLSSLSSA